MSDISSKVSLSLLNVGGAGGGLERIELIEPRFLILLVFGVIGGTNFNDGSCGLSRSLDPDPETDSCELAGVG